jgi:glycosyltransferase involved in cell wall biosynthesis
MKILLINYRYFVSGGPERYMFNVKSALEEEGHEVIPFSIHYPNNEESEYANYFVSPLDDSGLVYFEQHKPDLKTYLKTIERLFYSRDVEQSLTELIEKTKPDVAYVLHYLRKLSPSILVAAKKMKVPIVVRLSDYQMICPQAHCLRDGVPCELCVGGSLYSSIRFRCIKGSKAASIINYAATKYHLTRGYFNQIDKFVLTNEFAKQMMLKGGYDDSRVVVIPTFVKLSTVSNLDAYRGEYITYIGRLDPTKGVELVVKAFCDMYETGQADNIRLIVIGEGSERYKSKLMAITQQHGACDNIQFLGQLEKEDVDSYLAGALMNVVPSRWYENLPNVVLESFSAGTPVIASDIGSLSEMLEGGKAGLLFESGSSSDLSTKIAELVADKERLQRMSVVCRRIAREKYSQQEHVARLLAVFEDMIR